MLRDSGSFLSSVHSTRLDGDRRRRPALLLTLAIFVIGSALAISQTPSLADHAPPGEFVATEVFNGLDRPTVVSFASDGRLFVGHKDGTISVFSGLNDTNGPDVITTLRTEVMDYWDRGLVGLATHPNFAAQPYVYAFYSHDRRLPAQEGVAPPGTKWNDNCTLGFDPGCYIGSRLVRIPIGSNNQPSGPFQVLLEGRWCQQTPGHSAGSLAFGPDGALYATHGDGAAWAFTDYGQAGGNLCGDPVNEGGALRSIDLLSTGDPTSLDGTVIRIDPITGAAVPSNPLVGQGPSDDDRIIAYGLRNPWRLAIQPGSYNPGAGTGPRIYLSDVGWNRSEEINVIPNPTDGVVENFGWPCYEGVDRQTRYDSENLPLCEGQYSGAISSALTNPAFSYRHGQPASPGPGCVAGGSSAGPLEFYDGGDYPNEFDGALFFGDYSRGCVWVIYPGAGGNPDPSTIEQFMSDAGLVVDLKRGPGGDLFMIVLADFEGSQGTLAPNSGRLLRIEYFEFNRPPVAVVSANPMHGSLPLTVNFMGSNSFDDDHDPLTYAWDLNGNGQFTDSTAANPSRTYNSAGLVTVSLRVSDGVLTSTESITIGPGNSPPVPSIDAFPSNWQTGNTINLSGSATDAEDGPIGNSDLVWTIILHHCETESSCHAHEVTSFTGSNVSFTAPSHEYPSFLEAVLRATDSFGVTGTTSIELQPRTVEVTLLTEPSGLEVRALDSVATAPYTFTAIAGSPLGIVAPSPQTIDGFAHTFVSWSDGGAAAHDIVPTQDLTLTATFTHNPFVPPEWPPGADLNVSDVTETSATVSWPAATDNHEVAGYSVYLGEQLVGSIEGTSFGLTDLLAGSLHSVQVEARDGDGNTSDERLDATITTPDDTAPAWPAPSLTAVGTPGSVVVSWTAATDAGTIDEYQIFADGALIGTTDALTFVHPVAPGQTRTYTVSASDPKGNSSFLPSSASATSLDLAPARFGLVDRGKWTTNLSDGSTRTFWFGAPGDLPFVGDWNGDGLDTPGLYRQSDGFVYLRNTFTTGVAEIQFFFGNPNDIPIAGDWNGDGLDTVGVYRRGRVFLSNELGANNGFFVAERDFWFGIPGDIPFTGDFDGDGIDDIGLYRPSSGFVYFTLDQPDGGVARTFDSFFYGMAGDQVVAGDWLNQGIDSVGIYRAADGAFYLRYSNSEGPADAVHPFTGQGRPVAGVFG